MGVAGVGSSHKLKQTCRGGSCISGLFRGYTVPSANQEGGLTPASIGLARLNFVWGYSCTKGFLKVTEDHGFLYLHDIELHSHRHHVLLSWLSQFEDSFSLLEKNCVCGEVLLRAPGLRLTPGKPFYPLLRTRLREGRWPLQ